MAITPSYEHSVVLKKLTVGGETYWLKDADLRTLVESFGSAVYKDVVTTFSAEGTDLATEAATAAYIKEQIAAMEGVLRFKAVLTKSEGQTYRQAIDAWYTAKSEKPRVGDVMVFKADGKEFICINAGTGISSAEWEEIGDQTLYLTKTEAAATYTPLTRTIAGVDLQDNITAAELQSALSLKALAYKDSASGSVNVIDAINNITVGKAGEYDVTGQSTVDVPVTYNALDVTPAGTVAVTADTAAAASYQKATSAVISSAAPTGEQVANYTPAGSVAITAGTAAAASYKKVTSAVISAATPTGEQVANYTPAGSVAITAGTAAAASYKKATSVTISSAAPAGEQTANYTPAGSVAITAGTAAAASYQKATSATISAAAPTGEQVANYTPAGSVSLTGVDVATVTSSGTAYSITDGSVTKGDDTKAKFVKKGLSYAVDADEQCLTLAYVANTDTDFYTDAVTAAGSVSYTAPVLSGALPTFGTQEVAAKTGATFSGTGTILSNAIGYTDTAATVTQPTYTAAFTGTGAVLSNDISYTDTDATMTQPTYTAAFSGTGAVLSNEIGYTDTDATVTQPTYTAAFTGTGAVLSNEIGYTDTAATMTQPTYTAAFTGTAKNVTPSAATTSPAAATGGKVTVASQDTAITHTTKSVSVTVS